MEILLMNRRHLKWKLLGCSVMVTVICLIFNVFYEDVTTTQTAHMVCLTINPTKLEPSPSEGKWFAGDKAYDLPSRWCGKVQKHITIYTESPPWIRPSKWLGGFWVKYRPLSELPSSHKIIEHQTAYFLGNHYDFSPENFFHFTKQIYFPLYWLIKSTNQLHKGAENIVFYPFVYAICHSGKYWYHDMFRYEYFKRILHIKTFPELSAHHDSPHPHNVCYKNAVFSSEIFLEKATEAIDFFKDTLNISDNACGSNNSLVILDRTANRRILNMREIKEVGRSLGYDTKVVLMEKLSLKEQAQLVHCTKVLAGVTGAGLQWAFFMKNHSGVVEIGWPHKDWPLFFTGKGRYQSGENVIRPLKFAKVSQATCKYNPWALNKYWEEIFYTNAPFTEEESLAIVKDQRNYHFSKNGVTSLGKLCDVVVDKDAFRKALISVGK